MQIADSFTGTRATDRERGVVTLAIGILLLVLITLITLFGARVTVVEQRVAGNDYRAREASGTAQAGLNYGFEYARAYQGIIRSSDVGGWLDGTLDLANDNPEWSDPVEIDCTAAHPAGSKEKTVCDSGFDGFIRFFGAQDPNVAFVPTDLSTYDVPMDWPPSASGALDDCPGPDCRVRVEMALCEFTTAPPAGTCEDAGGTAPQYAVLVLARGVSEDGTAQASVRQAMTLFDFIPGSALPPIMATGNVAVSGDLNIVLNPDGAGPGTGIPLSAWSNGDLVFSGDLKFCYEDGYFQQGGGDLTSLTECNPGLDNQPCVAEVTIDEGSCPLPVCDTCSCPGPGDYDFQDYLTYAEGPIANDGIDVVDVDNDAGGSPDSVNFPDDVFNYVFGIPHEDYLTLKSFLPADHIIGDCSGIDDTSSGLYWVEGNCHLTDTVGSPDGPVIIITEGDFNMQGGGTYFGLAFAFSDPDNPDNPIPGGDVDVRGSAKIYGVIVSDHQIDLSNGTFDAIYSDCMFKKLISDDTFKRLGPVPGTWADHI